VSITHRRHKGVDEIFLYDFILDNYFFPQKNYDEKNDTILNTILKLKVKLKDKK